MNVALLFAGGIGSRMGNQELPKQFIEIEGKAVIIWSILAFEKHDEIDKIVVVCVDDWISHLKELIAKEGIKKVEWIVPGGPTGQQSIYNGVKEVYDHSEEPDKTVILINDGVRPFVKKEIISHNIECVHKNGTSATSSYVTETIINIDENGLVVGIPDRSKCMLSKAPQGFILQDLIDVHHKAIAENNFAHTNSIELMRHYGHKIYVVEDTAENIKLTTPVDVDLARLVIDRYK